MSKIQLTGREPCDRRGRFGAGIDRFGVDGTPGVW
jgi:hypothetical protein